MCHGHDGARVLLEEALEPGDGFGIQMVGGLVEQQQIGLLEQQPAQRHAAALAAREVAHLGVAGRQAQRVHRLLERAIELPRAGRVDAILELRLLFEQRRHLVVLERLGELRGDRLEAGEQRARLGHALFDVAEHVLRRVELRLLL